MGQVVAQRLKHLANRICPAPRHEADLVAQPLVPCDDLQLVGELQTVDQGRGLISALPFLQEQLCLLDPGGGNILHPAFIRKTLLDQRLEPHLDRGEQAEQPHPHGRVLQVGAGDEAADLAQDPDKRHRLILQGADRLNDGCVIPQDGHGVKRPGVIATDPLSEILPIDIPFDRSIPAQTGDREPARRHGCHRVGRCGRVEREQRLGDVSHGEAAQKYPVDIVVFGLAHMSGYSLISRLASVNCASDRRFTVTPRPAPVGTSMVLSGFKVNFSWVMSYA